MITNKKILITGASSGLGRSLANILLERNNKIYSLSRSKIFNKKIKSQICNFKSILDIKKKLNKLILKKIDYVFLNAGILGEIKKIEKINSKELLEILKINFIANKEIIDFIIKKKIKPKLIVGISSGAALKPKYGWYLYTSSKSAFKFLLDSYAEEHPDYSFINISPGLIKTKMQDQIYKVDEKKIKSVKKFKIANKNNMIPTADVVAKTIIQYIEKNKKIKNSYIDLRKSIKII